MADREALIRTWGSPAISPLALTRGKEWFRHDRGAIAHVAGLGLRLALGEPLGPPETREELLDAFLRETRSRGQQAAFLPVGDAARSTFMARGFHAVRLGREARLPLRGFQVAGTARKTVRQSSNRMRRRGYRVCLLDPPHEPELLGRLESLSRAWLSRRPVGELHFGTGAFDRTGLQTSLLAVARDAGGRPAAFVSLFAPHPGREAGIDLMRHHPDAPSGIMDFLFTETALALRDRGFSSLNLGLAPLAGLTPRGAGPMEEHILAFVRQWAPGYSFRGLESFKAKFRPEWEDRHLVCSARAGLLPALVVACELTPADLGKKLARRSRSMLNAMIPSWPTTRLSRLRDRRSKEAPCWSIVSTRT